MVLKSLLHIGLILLLAYITTCTAQNQQSQFPTQETTTISVNTTTLASKSLTSPTTSTTTTTQATEKPLTTSTTLQPKTDITQQNNILLTEQTKTRGNTKYSDTYTTIKPLKLTTIRTVLKGNKDNRHRQTTIRNDRSLNINTDKYNPELHSENNIYAETQVIDNKKYFNVDNKDRLTTEKTWHHSNLENLDFTNFDSIQLTTPKDVAFDGKFKKMHEDISKSLAIPPKDEVFDNKYKKMHEDISKSLDETVDAFFNEKKTLQESDMTEKPHLNDSKIDYMRFRNLEHIESTDNKKTHKDYQDEKGMKMEMSSAYNDTKIIDQPGIVVNTIPTKPKDTDVKKTDLEQGETKIEKISIEKPNTFISNKIETESRYSGATEGFDDKPLENKAIYLSKRGSTIQNKGHTIEKTLSTESTVPQELLPSKASTTLEGTATNSSVTKDLKKLSKILKKELDLDNKIPKFPESTTKSQKIEETTKNSQNLTIESLDVTTEITDDSPITTLSEISTTLSNFDVDTTESPNFTDTATQENKYYDATVEKDASTTEFSDFYEMTASTITEEDTTTYTESTSEHLTDASSIDDISEISTQTTLDVTENGLSQSDEVPRARTTILNEAGTDSKITGVLGFQNETVSLENEQNKTTVVMGVTEDDSGLLKNENLNLTTESVVKNEIAKKNESIPKVINEITKPPTPTTTTLTPTNSITTTKKIQIPWQSATENIINFDDTLSKDNSSKNIHSENDTPKQNEININGDKTQPEDCDNLEDGGEDYPENNCKQNGEDNSETDVDLEDHNGQQIVTQNDKKSSTTVSSSTTNAVTLTTATTEGTTERTTNIIKSTTTLTTTEFIEEKKRILNTVESDSDSTTRSDSIISAEDEEEEGGNGGKIAAIVISTIGGICLLLLVALLIIMKKRQKRFNYGQRCRPVSLDAYSMDNVSIHNSTRRKGVLMMSKRSYGNPAFEDPASPTHPLNYSELLKFANNLEAIKIEFDKIPQVTTKTNELPEGCDVKNRYANVIPLPETRVFLNPIDGVHGSDYINANYVTGPQGARNYYIACQAPMQNTIDDFWRMIWEQQSKVILMLTHLYENGIEKCIDYLPPSEVLDCHRLFGDFQITLKKREVKDKYIISSLQLKNMVSNSWREVTHFWYMGWPEKGVPEEANSLIAFLIEARSYIKVADTKVKETNNESISNGFASNLNAVIVHCSPGTGRTGTVIACDIAVREFELTRKIDIPRIVYKVRRDRASAVQTKEQYCFIYKVIHFYATKLTGGIFDSF